MDSNEIRKKFPQLDKLGITDYDLPIWLIRNHLDYLIKLDSDNITLDDYWVKLSKNKK